MSRATLDLNCTWLLSREPNHWSIQKINKSITSSSLFSVALTRAGFLRNNFSRYLFRGVKQLRDKFKIATTKKESSDNLFIFEDSLIAPSMNEMIGELDSTIMLNSNVGEGLPMALSENNVVE